MSNDTYSPPPSVSSLFGSEMDGEREARLGRERRKAAEARGQTLTRSADRLSQRVERVRAEALAQRQRRALGAIAVEHRQDAALERAIDLINRGGEPGAQTRRDALAAADRLGIGPKLSSAEQHAADYAQGAGFDFEV
jgi:hypothetical protein